MSRLAATTLSRQMQRRVASPVLLVHLRLLVQVTPLDMHGDTLLMAAERRGHDEIEKLLREHGATPF